jgi:hypothetical protein
VLLNSRHKNVLRECFSPFKSALSPSQQCARERRAFLRVISCADSVEENFASFYEDSLEEAEEVKFLFFEETFEQKKRKKGKKAQNLMQTTEPTPPTWRRHHHRRRHRRRRHRPEGPLCCVLLKSKKLNLETRGENHPKAFILEGEGV